MGENRRWEMGRRIDIDAVLLARPLMPMGEKGDDNNRLI
jgi:hypothetical protein